MEIKYMNFLRKNMVNCKKKMNVLFRQVGNEKKKRSMLISYKSQLLYKYSSFVRSLGQMCFA